MSYQIVYGKSFIKTPKGRVIPLTLNGSNNCTEYVNGREVRERHWSCFVPDSFLILPQDEFLSSCKKKYPTDTEVNYEAFKSNSKWVYEQELFKWFERGVKNAALLEDYRTRANNKIILKCSLAWYENNTFVRDYERPVTTSAQLDDWLDKANRLKQEKSLRENINSYFCFDIPGVRIPLHVKRKIDGLVVCKLKNKWLISYSDNNTTFSSSPKDVIVFNSIDDAKEKLGEYRFSRYRIVKAENAFKKKPYIIKSSDLYNLYIKGIKKNLYYTESIDNAIGFSTQKAAQKYIDKNKSRFSTARGWKIEKR